MAETGKNAERCRQLFDNLKTGSWQKWRTNSQKDRDFAYGDQLTKDELEALKKAGMPTFTVDKIGPSLETLRYFITSNNPQFKAIGTEGSDARLADIHTAVIRHSFYISGFKSVFSLVADDSLSSSLGWFKVDIDPNLDMGAGEVVFHRLDPNDVYVDSACTDIMFRDAAFIMIKKDFKKEYMHQWFGPKYKGKIDKATGPDEHSTTYTERDTDASNSVQAADITGWIDREGKSAPSLPYYELYEKVQKELCYVTTRRQPSKAELSRLEQQVQMQMQEFSQQLALQMQDQTITLGDALKDGEISKERHDFELQKMQQQVQQVTAQQQQKLMSDAVASVAVERSYVWTKDEYEKNKGKKAFNIVEARHYWENRIKVTQCYGDQDLEVFELPIAEYPLIPIPYHFTGTPYPMSAVRKVVGKQEEVNKTHQVMVHNASLGSSLRWMHEQGALPNPEEWDTNSTIPGGRLVYNPGFNPPMPVLPFNLPNTFYDLIAKGERDIEETLGSSPSGIMGADKPGDIPYRGLLHWDEVSTRRIRAWMVQIVEPALEQLGKVFTALARTVYTAPKIIRLVDPDTGEEEKYEINTPIYDSKGDIVGRYFDYPSTTFDIRIVSGSTLPKNKQAELAEYLELYRLQIVDDIAVLEKTDLPNKGQILERKSDLMQAIQQLERMEAMLKDKEGTIETLERQLVQAGIKAKVVGADAELKKVVDETRAKAMAITAKYRAKQELIIGQMKQAMTNMQQQNARSNEGT